MRMRALNLSPTSGLGLNGNRRLPPSAIRQRRQRHRLGSREIRIVFEEIEECGIGRTAAVAHHESRPLHE